MGRKTNILLIILLMIVLISCGTTSNFKAMEEKRDKKNTEVIYNYNWEHVWDSMRYTIKHAKGKWLKQRAAYDDIEYDKSEKIISMKNYSFLAVGYDIAIWFYPIEYSKTKVQFVSWGYPAPYGNWAIEELIEELGIYLEK